MVGTLLALTLGIATHLIWDGLTHSDFRTFVFKDVLATNIHLLGHPYPLHRLLQLGSSALALPFIVWMCVHYYQRYKQHWKVSKKIKIFAWCLLFLSTVLGLFSFGIMPATFLMKFGMPIPIISRAAPLMNLCKVG